MKQEYLCTRTFGADFYSVKMKIPILYIYIFCILFSLPQNSFPQIVINFDMQYKYAIKLFEQKEYETAIVEFKRLIHFFPDNDNKDQAQLKIGICLFNLKRYHDAAQLFNQIILSGKENNITKQSYFYQSKAFLNMGNTGYAQIVLQNYLKLIESPEDKNYKNIETKDRIYFNLAQIHLADARNLKPDSLGLARDNLLKISKSNYSRYDVNQYLDVIDRVSHAHTKSPTAAGIFAIIPGGGFLYCKKFHDAFVTFLLNTGLAYAAYEAFSNDNKTLSYVIAFVETGFYSGNIYGSISCAHKYNQAQTIRILDQKLSVFSKIDRREKEYGLSLNFKF